MKKIVLAWLVTLGVSSLCGAADLWRSSQTATADATKPLCTASQRGTIYQVVVTSGAAASELTLYNSTHTITGSKSLNMMTATTGTTYEFRTQFPKGILYTKTGTGSVVILYECY